jgi:hypothetical protein
MLLLGKLPFIETIYPAFDGTFGDVGWLRPSYIGRSNSPIRIDAPSLIKLPVLIKYK